MQQNILVKLTGFGPIFTCQLPKKQLDLFGPLNVIYVLLFVTEKDQTFIRLS